MQFLMGLNDVCSVIRSNMLVSSPLPPVIHAFKIVFQEKSHKTLFVNNDKSAVAFIAKKTF